MIKLGVIGCGGIARHHAKTIQEGVRGISIVAAADLLPDALMSFGADFGVASLHADYRKMLALVNVDAVCVALPTHVHRKAVVDAAAAGKNVFCEKPMARSLSDCDAMIDACKGAGVTLMIGQVRRYDTDWGAWKKIVQNGTIGRPVLWRQTAGGPGPGSWYMDDKKGGGPFLDGCVHNWDYANLVFGKPAVAVGSMMRLADTTALDTGSVAVRYESGDAVVLNWSWGLPQGVRAGSMTDILGPKGVVHFPGYFSESEYPQDFNKELYGAYFLSLNGKSRIAKFRRQNMFAAEWKDFKNSIEKNKTPLVTGEIGRQAVAVALAALKAGRSGKPVRIGG